MYSDLGPLHEEREARGVIEGSILKSAILRLMRYYRMITYVIQSLAKPTPPPVAMTFASLNSIDLGLSSALWSR
jgi:hypothetical protein